MHRLPLVPLLALVVTAAIFIGALTIIKTWAQHPSPSHSSPTGAPPPASSGPPAPLHLSRTDRRVIDNVMKAEGAADRRDNACLPEVAGLEQSGPGRKPDLSPGAPSQATLATLARPARNSDRLPPRVLGAPPNQRVYPDGTYPPMKGIYVRYIRQARHRFGANYYLVPAADANTLSPVPERCYAEQRTALRQELPTIPANLRKAALSLQSRYIAHERASLLPYPGVCLSAINDTGNGDGCSSGYSLSQIVAGHTLTSGAPTGVPVAYGLAPTGVRTVTLYYPDRKPPHRPRDQQRLHPPQPPPEAPRRRTARQARVARDGRPCHQDHKPALIGWHHRLAPRRPQPLFGLSREPGWSASTSTITTGRLIAERSSNSPVHRRMLLSIIAEVATGSASRLERVGQMCVVAQDPRIRAAHLVALQLGSPRFPLGGHYQLVIEAVMMW